MRTVLDSTGHRLFSKNQYLTAQQIISFWSRYASNMRENAAAARQQPNLNEIPNDEYRHDSNLPTEEEDLWAVVSPHIELS